MSFHGTFAPSVRLNRSGGTFIFMQTSEKQIPEVGELSLAIVAKLPEHDEIQVRYLKATKKRPHRVKLNYLNRRSVTFIHTGTHFVLQAAAELLERGITATSYHLSSQTIARLAVEPQHRLLLDSIFPARKSNK
jgi:hypothetical protein